MMTGCMEPKSYQWFRVCRLQATVAEIGVCASSGSCAVRWTDDTYGVAPFPMVGKTYGLDCVWTTELDVETKAKYPYEWTQSDRPYR